MVENFDIVVKDNFSIKDNVSYDIVCLNMNTWSHCVRYKEYEDIFTSSLVLCDGFWTLRLLKLFKKETILLPGPDFFRNSILADEGLRNCILGSSEKVQMGLKKYLIRNGFNGVLYDYPIPFVGLEDFDYKSIAREMYSRSIEIVWISLGAPKQEYFLKRLRQELSRDYPNYTVSLVAIGAAIDFYSDSGAVSRAPSFFRRMGMEWLWRMFRQPSKTFKRLLNEITTVPIIIYNEFFKK